MDISDGIESEVPLVVIPEHLVFAFEEWIAEMIKRACDAHGSPKDRSTVINAVHLHDAFVAGSLTPAQTAELAGCAAGWLEPEWPKRLEDADEVKRLAAVTRELLELRDHALTVAANNTNIGRVVVVDPGVREILRSQTLLVLEFSHGLFEDVCDLDPTELLVEPFVVVPVDPAHVSSTKPEQ